MMNDLQKTFNAVLKAKHWFEDANCRNMDVNLFFEMNRQGVYDPFVREVCGSCPVVEECLWYANETHSQEGFFGNMSPRERMRWRKVNDIPMGMSKEEYENRNRNYLSTPVTEWRAQ